MSGFEGIPVWRHCRPTPVPVAHGEPEPCRVLVVGAGPVGLTVALGLARAGHPVTIVSRLPFIAAGSKAICFSKRSLDIWNRLGVARAMVDKGVVWNVGKVFKGASDAPIYQFDMLPVKDQAMPGFINLQQYYVEAILVDALAALPNVELRWGHEVVGLARQDTAVDVSLRASDGSTYRIRADWLIACDGSRSPVRRMLELDFAGRVFEDHFLIADVKLRDERPAERWFWFDPPFNPGRSALLHKQPDDIWRLDFQLGPDVDRKAVLRADYVEALVRGMLGPGIRFEREWYSLYTFQCRRMARFVHGRVIFAGDSAHLVSPFGARGCNGGVADADNLVWKLDLVLRGAATERLLESYNTEAIVTADENILNSTRATDFIVPKSPGARLLRDAVLDLARDHGGARPFVNSGRLSTAVAYADGPLNTADETGAAWAGIAPGAAALDAPFDGGWLLERLGGRFVLLAHRWSGGDLPDGAVIDIAGKSGADLVAERFDLTPGSACLVRPDQYVAARWRKPTLSSIAQARVRATGGSA
jgi:3-(3-hydroxy-phenyl)propionate hydroxylase